VPSIPSAAPLPTAWARSRSRSPRRARGPASTWYGYYNEVLSRGQLAGFDQGRLDKILSLPRSGLLKGKAGFYGYIVLQFDLTPKVLLECPVHGNAIYVLDSGEERLLGMNMQQLIASDEAKRIFHTGDWLGRVQRELGISASTV
jgi:hypothetical protein